ncbi:MAG: Segregation and condensation protein B [uncultured Rubrobacteraceae bacterium]|uniref:Segregation and condensation protein B n=1 Tax=uncultured Rubrobacteraceae bacterium TaxID=349277 RepID=A0A6J4QXJ8_9ACTN|nr:MAG: Segregation and condensation protein B [uncultured Rubrobacteraceae bacterium]
MSVRRDNLEQGTPDAAALIEAVLLVSPRPVTLPALLSATALPESEARAALEALGARYSSESSGIVLREVAGGYQLATNPSCEAAVERFREEARPAPLSGAAHEVLSCVLYLGPLTRAGVNAARGVNSDAVVRNLLDRNLLIEAGRDQTKPGAPALLDVTEDFLLAAGARSRDDFPALAEIVDEAEISRVRERVSGAAERPVEAPHGGDG